MKRLLLLPLLLLGSLLAMGQAMTGPSGYGTQQNHIAALKFFRPPVLDDTLCDLVVNATNGDCFGALLILRSDNQLYRRDSVGWRRVGGVSANLYNSDGALSGNRIVDGGTNGLTFNNLSQFNVNSNVYSWFSPSTGAGIASDGLSLNILGSTGVSNIGTVIITAGKPEDYVTIGHIGGLGTGNSGVRFHNLVNNVAEDSVLTTDASGLVKMKIMPPSFWTANGSDIYNSNAGDVGIGTANPLSKLDVNGDIASNVSLTVTKDGSASVSGTITMYNAAQSRGANIQLTDGGNPGMAFWNTTPGGGWQENVRITTAGNMGIGTTNPVTKLQVDGRAYINHTALGSPAEPELLVSNGLSASSFEVYNDALQTYIGTFNNTHLAFVNNAGTERMRLTAGGNFGIGTTSPATKLNLNSGHLLISGGVAPPSSGSGLAAWMSGSNAIIRNRDFAAGAGNFDNDITLVGEDITLETQESGTLTINFPLTNSTGNVAGLPAAASNHFITRQQLTDSLNTRAVLPGGTVKNVTHFTSGGTFALTSTHSIVICKSVSQINLTLPSAAANIGREYIVKQLSGSSVTINRSGSDVIYNINGDLSTSDLDPGLRVSMGCVNGFVHIVSDGVSWYVLEIDEIGC